MKAKFNWLLTNLWLIALLSLFGWFIWADFSPKRLQCKEAGGRLDLDGSCNKIIVERLW